MQSSAMPDQYCQALAPALWISKYCVLSLIGILNEFASPDRKLESDMRAFAQFGQAAFNLRLHDHQNLLLASPSGLRAIERDDFPFEKLSDIAEVESWRKEINRPIYHIHKWWAQRLGSVFRAILLGVFATEDQDVLELFYKPVRINGATVFDPFMGSGTTVGETLKVGARAIGRDINPVAHFLVRNALSVHDRKKILQIFTEIERDVALRLRSFFQTRLKDHRMAEVLYFFWVKTVACPNCDEEVDLFSSYVFAQHAYRKKYPKSHALCPHCGEVNQVLYDDTQAHCQGCSQSFRPQAGPAKGQKATCPVCDHCFSIAKAIREDALAPSHRLYAKLVLTPDGDKVYLAANDEDRALYQKAEAELKAREGAYPVVAIAPGYNTNQALGYNYRHWHEMFNARQLLCLSILAERIRQISDPVVKDLFTCLFSGALEFNNLFTSYKGEGTGAVRHMFAHHILKPERVPLEANIWGTKKSSGSFLTMFEGRIRRALDYADDPFELYLDISDGKRATKKIYGLSEKLGFDIADNFKAFAAGKAVYLSCGDSSHTDISDASVDAIISDPPFFDNVHYSQLADFFHVWQRHILAEDRARTNETTRSAGEVQNADVALFTERLQRVWAEASRVLKEDGVLAFTYHHSRPEGWSSVLCALMKAGFAITAAQPIKAEMSVAMPKHQAKEPIDLDIILVCRKRERIPTKSWDGDLWPTVMDVAAKQVLRFSAAGRALSRNDVRVIIMAQLLRQITASEDIGRALALLEANKHEVEIQIEKLHATGAASVHQLEEKV